jgi:hypothetical protein
MALKVPATVYVAGPMRGLPDYGFPIFRAATKDLRSRGFHVHSPAERDVRAHRDPARVGLVPLRQYMADDLRLVCQSDAVVVLPGWQKSVGACLETLTAAVCSIPVLAYADDLAEIPADFVLRRAPRTLRRMT